MPKLSDLTEALGAALTVSDFYGKLRVIKELEALARALADRWGWVAVYDLSAPAGLRSVVARVTADRVTWDVYAGEREVAVILPTADLFVNLRG